MIGCVGVWSAVDEGASPSFPDTHQSRSTLSGQNIGENVFITVNRFNQYKNIFSDKGGTNYGSISLEQGNFIK